MSEASKTMLLILGAGALVLAAIMFWLGVTWFTTKAELPPIIDWIGAASFWGWLPLAVVGLILVILGAYKKSA